MVFNLRRSSLETPANSKLSQKYRMLSAHIINLTFFFFKTLFDKEKHNPVRYITTLMWVYRCHQNIYLVAKNHSSFPHLSRMLLDHDVKLSNITFCWLSPLEYNFYPENFTNNWKIEQHEKEPWILKQHDCNHFLRTFLSPLTSLLLNSSLVFLCKGHK